MTWGFEASTAILLGGCLLAFITAIVYIGVCSGDPNWRRGASVVILLLSLLLFGAWAIICEIKHTGDRSLTELKYELQLIVEEESTKETKQ